MPAKGKRVASRQAQLNRRRRRQARSGAEASLQTAVIDGEPASNAVAPPTGTATVSAVAIQPPSAVQVQPQPEAARVAERGRSQNRSAQPMAYTHLGAEVRRIGVLAGIVTVVLVAVSFVV